jgi:hypothetical protein
MSAAIVGSVIVGPTVWAAARTLAYPQGGDHLWVYLNWTLGLSSLRCRVVWLEEADPNTPVHWLRGSVIVLKYRLARHGVYFSTGETVG